MRCQILRKSLGFHGSYLACLLEGTRGARGAPNLSYDSGLWSL
jgi:hypothetical protein